MTVEGTVVEGVDQAAPLALVKAERSGVLLMPVMNVQTAMARLREFQEFVQGYLQESKDGGNDGGDYGTLPGTQKKTLLKSGADKLCEVYGLYDEYEVVAKVEDWDRGLFDYELRCVLKSRRDDSIVGTGLGSCSTFESKYRWRVANRMCPTCGAEAIIRGKAEYGGGWICFVKKGGCGAKFDDTDPSITRQDVGRVENPDVIDLKNTALKMAKKRAKIDAVIGVTRSSGLFTQDMEDLQPADEVKVEAVKVDPENAGAPREQQANGSAQAAQTAQRSSTPAPSSSNGNGGGAGGGAGGGERKISEAQAKRMFAIARDAGVQGEDYKNFLRTHGYSDDRDVRRCDYEKLCAQLQDW